MMNGGMSSMMNSMMGWMIGLGLLGWLLVAAAGGRHRARSLAQPARSQRLEAGALEVGDRS